MNRDERPLPQMDGTERARDNAAMFDENGGDIHQLDAMAGNLDGPKRSAGWVVGPPRQEKPKRSRDNMRDLAAEHMWGTQEDPGEVCNLCDEPGTLDDPLTDWIVPNDASGHAPVSNVRMAHGQCGEDAGWRMS